MFLRDVILLFGLLMLLVVPLLVMVQVDKSGKKYLRNNSYLVAGLVVIFWAVILMFRNNEFGTDTVAYINYFNDYCQKSDVFDKNLSYWGSMFLINIVTLGACDANLLPGAWAITIILALMFMCDSRLIRIQYIALLLLSFIGIELTTNAMRQGFSVTIFMLAVSFWYHRKNFRALLFIIFSIALHPSSALILFLFIGSLLHIRYYLVVFLLTLSLTFYSIHRGLSYWFLDSLLYEIQKYMQHDNSDLWVRIIALTSVVMTVVTPFLCIYRNRFMVYIRGYEYGLGLRLLLSSIPFLFLPYMGYRVIYGIYPVVLYFTLKATEKEGRTHIGKYFYFLLSLNLFLLFFWASGSSAMLEVPFLNDSK